MPLEQYCWWFLWSVLSGKDLASSPGLLIGGGGGGGKKACYPLHAHAPLLFRF